LIPVLGRSSGQQACTYIGPLTAGIRQQLRTLHIHAALHAAFRWDKARRFTSNNLYDFEHASAALAYCQLFFTEDWLHSTITARHTEAPETNLNARKPEISGPFSRLSGSLAGGENAWLRREDSNFEMAIWKSEALACPREVTEALSAEFIKWLQTLEFREPY
jgi:hypothetical protein